VGLSPTERASLCWTHNGCQRVTKLAHLVTWFRPPPVAPGRGVLSNALAWPPKAATPAPQSVDWSCGRGL